MEESDPLHVPQPAGLGQQHPHPHPPTPQQQQQQQQQRKQQQEQDFIQDLVHAMDGVACQSPSPLHDHWESFQGLYDQAQSQWNDQVQRREEARPGPPLLLPALMPPQKETQTKTPLPAESAQPLARVQDVAVVERRPPPWSAQYHRVKPILVCGQCFHVFSKKFNLQRHIAEKICTKDPNYKPKKPPKGRVFGKEASGLGKRQKIHLVDRLTSRLDALRACLFKLRSELLQ